MLIILPRIFPAEFLDPISAIFLRECRILVLSPIPRQGNLTRILRDGATMTLLGCSTHGGAFLSESAAVHAPSFTPPPIHFAYPLLQNLTQNPKTDLPADFTDFLMSPATQLRPSLLLPPNQNPQNLRSRRLFINSCVQVQSVQLLGRRLHCSLVTYRFRHAPSSRLADGPF
jgi:hypothetical protein